MAWDRGAWERTTSGASNNAPKSYPHIPITNQPKRVSNKQKDYLKKTLVKFKSQGWNISNKKKDQYLNNNFYNAPYRLPNNTKISKKICKLISSKSNKNKFLVVSNNESILDDVLLEYSIKDNYKIFKSSKSASLLENLMNNVEEFEKINTQLFNKYAIKIFSDIESINQIHDLKILSENLYYIDNSSAKLLNEFIKAYWQFYEVSNFSSIDLTLAERDVISEVKRLINELNSIKNYIKRLKGILELLDLKIEDIDKIDIDILENNPYLINSKDANNFISLLDKYQKINFSGNISSTYLKEFSSNSFILGILANFKRYVDGQSQYEEINGDILNLKNQFKSNGLNFDNLNQYYEIKDKLNQFENVSYIDDNAYLRLNEKLKEFLNNNCSFNDYFKRCRDNVIFNLDSNSIYLNVNKSLENIMDICKEYGFKIESLADFDNNQDNFKILIDYVNFNKNNTVANEDTIREYARNLFDDLKEICDDLIENSMDVDRSELDYIVYNISTLKRLIRKIGLNVNSLNELNDSFSVIANIENDRSNNIFSNQSESFLQNNKFEIYNDLDTLKSTLDYLCDKFKDQPNLLNYPIDNLSQSFNNQFKIDFLKSNIEFNINSTNSFEEILQNYEVIIQNVNNLMDANNDFKHKNDVDKILKNLNSILTMNENKNYSSNQLMIDNISSYKGAINNDFNKLVRKGIFSKDKIENCDIENVINELRNHIKNIRGFVNANSAYRLSFNEILENNKLNIMKNDEIKNKFENADIYNFYDICRKFNKSDYDYEIVKEILDLSSALDLNEFNKFLDFQLEDIENFSRYLDNCIEFSEHVDNGLIDKSFNFSQFKSTDFNSKIESIKQKLIDLKLDSSIVDDFSQLNLDKVDEINEKLIKIEENMQKDTSNVDELIQNNQLTIIMLLNLCNDYYIEFEINNNKFNSSDFKFKLEEIKEDLDNHIRLYELEKEILSNKFIIENNLSDIWNGPLTDIDVIRNKFEIDEKFTELYNDEVFTQNSISNISEISSSDLIFLKDFKNMESDKPKYITFYKNYNSLNNEVNLLNEVNKEDYSSLLNIFININRVYKSVIISECITLLEYNIKHIDSIKLVNEYEKNLKSYSIVYYKYFNRNTFDLTIEEIIKQLEAHFIFTDLIDNKIVNERYLDSIKSDFKEFSKQVDLLVTLKNKIINDCMKYFGRLNISFEELKQNWSNVENSNLVLMNLNSLRNSFNSNFISYFDHVYVVDDYDLTDEDKLHLFLISKNKLSYLMLMDG